ncbi:MAG: PilZ domain-containing protein [SAR324 cluster bacterium]|nr:PilZ domain-containing protein [SAR324 cluster bacterium]
MTQFILLAQSINLDLSVFRSDSGVSSRTTQLIGTVLVILILVGLVALVGYIFNQRKRMRNLSEQREESRLRLLVSELTLNQKDLKLLSVITESEDPAKLVPVMEDRVAFEKNLVRFLEAHPNSEALKGVNKIRQKMEFGFNNIRNPFNHTRMMATGIRMQCRVKLPKKEVTFLTSILGINENFFIIRPPSSKGKPVSLNKLKSLNFRVSRENDGEYEFSSPILGQQPDGVKAVRMGHTDDISRMLFRNAERVHMDLDTQFFVIRQEYATNRALASLKAVESQYRIQGSIRDLSTGGALVVADARKTALEDGDIIIFTLPQAQIREDLVSQVVGIMEPEKDVLQFHLQFQGMKEINRLKVSRFLDRLKENPPTPGEAEADSQAVS